MDADREGPLDPQLPYRLAYDELTLRRETGHEVSSFEARIAELAPEDHTGLAVLYEALLNTEQGPGWDYVEPSDLAGINAVLPVGMTPEIERPALDADKFLGGWLGRIAGCNLGKPVESVKWTSARLREYLELADAYPLDDYIPALDPMPDGFEFRECWTETTRGRIDGSARDDDIDYSILALHLLETHGPALQRRHVAEAWVSLFPYHQVFTAERAAYRNLVSGVPVADVATHHNPYREWIGAQIRGDVFGWVSPGAPRAAALLSFRDASLSHVRNGIYGEMWVAALAAAAFGAATLKDALVRSLDHIPPKSRLAEALSEVLDLHNRGCSWEQALEHIQRRFGHYYIVHSINNAAVVCAGLLWGEHDYARTVGLTVQAGWDTDSNGATAGSIAGVFLGANKLPDRFVAPLDNRVRSALFGFDNSAISDLAQRTVRLASSGDFVRERQTASTGSAGPDELPR